VLQSDILNEVLALVTIRVMASMSYNSHACYAVKVRVRVTGQDSFQRQ